MMMAGNASKRLNAVQLGFSVEFEDHEHRSFVGHNLPLWRDWDGGQIGGKPSWLQPRDLPKDFLTCKNCEEPLCFICQLYAPADEVNPEAFHRSMYIFGCPSPGCAKAPTGSIRVLRAQLPRENPFYPDDEDQGWSQHVPECWDVNLCKVCGQRGKGKCPMQGFHFCGKHHQKEHKKYIFDKQQQLSKQLDFTFLPSVCSESELVVEEEPGQVTDEEMRKKSEKVLFPDGEEGAEKKDHKRMGSLTSSHFINFASDKILMAIPENKTIKKFPLIDFQAALNPSFLHIESADTFILSILSKSSS